LVGSIPLDSSSAVFAAVAQTLGELVKRMPDGEPGVRSGWILWQAESMRRASGIERAPTDRLTNSTPFPQFRLAPGATAADVAFLSLGFADEALASYALFARMKADGTIPRDVRFQVCLPTPLAVVFAFMLRVEEQVRPVWPAYERALFAEIDRIAAAIPPSELAVQWDIAAEFTTILEKPEYAATYSLDEVVAALARACNHVPAEVEVGLHFCYGDANHRHLVEPPDTRRIVTVANRLAPLLQREIAWLHLPIPRDRDDEAYLAPLRELALERAELYLGLVHLTDGVEGARRRLATAERVVGDFGIGTECGFGRRPPETIPALLSLHRTVAELN
jgi:hypothetical protein